MKSLKDYSDLFVKLNLTELSVEEGDFKICLKREAVAVPVTATMTVENTHTPNVQEEVPSPTKQKIDGTEVKAPLLGIFYASVGDRPALKVGDSVKSGDVLCTIEAMKMMNEVKASTDGTIKAICANEGDLVEYNQTLFVIG